MKKNSVQEYYLVTLLVLLVAVVGTQTGETSSTSPYCIGTGASEEYEAHKEHVLEELTDVTPTIQGYDYSTTFPSTPAAHAVVYGSAACAGDVGVSDCVYCLVEAKFSLLGESCTFMLAGAVALPLCNMTYVPLSA